MIRTRFLADITTGTGDTVDAVSDGEYPFYVRSQVPERIDAYQFQGEAVLTAGDGAGVGRVFHYVNERFAAHQRVYVLNNFRRITGKFFYYFFSAHFAEVARDGSARSTVDSVRRPMITNMLCPVPPLDEQLAIGDYLDTETAKIDTLIAKQEQLIATLRERRVGVIAATLDSGVGAGMPLSYLYDEIDERAAELGVDLDDVPLFSVSIHRGVSRREVEGGVLTRADDLSNYKVARDADIVINRMRAFQGALGLAREVGLVSPDYLVVRPRRSVDPQWLVKVMKTPAFVGEMSARIRGIGSAELGAARTPRINPDDLGRIRVSVPDLGEQRRIAAYLDKQMAKIDTLIAKPRSVDE